MRSIIAFLLVWSSQAFAAWDLNDVSYLMPLPKAIGSDPLMRTETAGKGGALLPAKLIQVIPPLAMGVRRDEALANLRALGVRIDPCFPLPTPQSCQKQIRIVWQPLQTGLNGAVQTVDAALHSFYVLNDQDFASLLKDLELWKKSHGAVTTFKPLQVHPAWEKEGVNSPALITFNDIIRKYAGSENLSRVTVMLLRGPGTMWVFAGFDVKEENLHLAPVPRLDRTSQSFFNSADPTDHFAGGGMAPIPQSGERIDNLTAESDRLQAGSEELIRNEVRSAFRIENPKNFNPENMDCVSCHVAQPAIQWVLSKRPELKADKLWSSEIYKNIKYDLNNLSPALKNTRMIRGFGYFGKDMAFSQRVINESAEVADALNLMMEKSRQP